MRLGAHIRISGGLNVAARRAAEIGCEALQIFAANPNSWRSRKIDDGSAAEFRRLVEEFNLRPVVIHTQYLVNLAAPDPDIYSKSTSAVIDIMNRALLLGAQYVVTHIGSHKGSGLEEGIGRIHLAISEALGQVKGVNLLLENSAGGGGGIGANFQEMRAILDLLAENKSRLGICLDTAHLWAAGYDVSSEESVGATIQEFDDAVGIEMLKLMHLNDTNVALGARRDRHANIGMGNIGEEGFSAILHHPDLSLLPGILETPAREAALIHDIDILKQLRG